MRTYRYILTALYASDRIKFLLKITQDLQYYRYPTYICINTMTYIHIYIIFFVYVCPIHICNQHYFSYYCSYPPYFFILLMHKIIYN